MSKSSEPHRTSETRQALLEQLAHLGDEVDKLKRHVELIPSEVLQGRPLRTDPSFKEMYGLLAVCDERVYSPAVLQLAASGLVEVDASAEARFAGEGAWNEMEMHEIIERIRSNRSKLVDGLAGLSLEAWHRNVIIDGKTTDVFGLAYHIIQHDAALLRSAAYRLHESRLTTREEDLPK